MAFEHRFHCTGTYKGNGDNKNASVGCVLDKPTGILLPQDFVIHAWHKTYIVDDNLL